MSIKDVSKIRAIIRDYKKVVLKLEELVKCKIGIKKNFDHSFWSVSSYIPYIFLYVRTAYVCHLLEIFQYCCFVYTIGPTWVAWRKQQQRARFWLWSLLLFVTIRVKKPTSLCFKVGINYLSCKRHAESRWRLMHTSLLSDTEAFRILCAGR